MSNMKNRVAETNRLWVPMVLFVIAFGSSSAFAKSSPGRVLMSPNKSHNSSSYIFRDISIPGASQLKINYEYNVDSQQVFDYCRTEYSFNGGPYVALFTMSGKKRGHNEHFVNVGGAGNLRLRFRYTKNASSSHHTDSCWVDDVVVQSGGGVYEAHRFDDAWPTQVPTGWVAGGSNGGWKADRPHVERSVGPVESQPAGTRTFMQRNVFFSSSNRNFCSLRYFVDTAPTHVMRVHDNSNVVFSASGRNQGATTTFDIGPGIGWHALQFSYDRDTLPTKGRNLVRVDDLVCFSGGVMVDRFDFNGEATMKAPHGWTVGCVPVGGSCAGIKRWEIHRTTPHRTYLSPETPSLTAAVDGQCSPSEYKNETRTLMPNWSSPNAKTGKITMSYYDDPSPTSRDQLYLFARLQADSINQVGQESGVVYLYFDERRDATLERLGECADYQLPGLSDRRVALWYNLGGGTAGQAIVGAQEKGDCAGGWKPLHPRRDEPLKVEAYVHDAGTDRVGVEIRLHLFDATSSAGRLGLALKHERGGQVGEHFPYAEDALGPTAYDDDAYRWETIELSRVPSAGGPELLEHFDDCCFARSDRRWTK